MHARTHTRTRAHTPHASAQCAQHSLVALSKTNHHAKHETKITLCEAVGHAGLMLTGITLSTIQHPSNGLLLLLLLLLLLSVGTCLLSSHINPTNGLATAYGAVLLPAGRTRTRTWRRVSLKGTAPTISNDEQNNSCRYWGFFAIISRKRCQGPVARLLLGLANLNARYTSFLCNAMS